MNSALEPDHPARFLKERGIEWCHIRHSAVGVGTKKIGLVQGCDMVRCERHLPDMDLELFWKLSEE